MNTKISEKEDFIVIDFAGVFKTLLKKFWIILLVACFFGIGFFCKAYFNNVPMYQSTARVYTVNASQNGSIDSVYSDIMLSDQLINDYEEIIKSRYVMESVVKEMKLDITAEALTASVNVNAIEDTRILEISVSNEDPLVARDLTNKVCEVAGERIVEVMNIEAINIIDEARIPEAPYNNNVISTAVKGFILGGFITAIIIVGISLLDTSVKTQDDVYKMTGLTALGVIPYDKNEDKGEFHNNADDFLKSLFKKKSKR